MSDRTSTGDRPPTAPENDAAKPPVSTQLTFSQHLFIWTLIIVVGVLFGMGGSMNVFFDRSSGPVNGISAREIEQRRDMVQRLAKILQENRAALGSRDPISSAAYLAMSNSYSNEVISLEIRRATIARKAGCAPSGAALDTYVNRWLDQVHGGRSNRDLLNEAVGGDHEIHFNDLKDFAADVLAYQEYEDRHVFAPAVPTAVSADVNRLIEDKVAVDTAVLQEASFIKPVDPKDPHIQDTYDRMRRAGSFVKPESVALTVAYADIAALTKKAAAAVTDAEARAYYDIHKAEPQYAQPKKPTPPPAQTKPAKPDTQPAAKPAPAATGAKPAPPEAKPAAVPPIKDVPPPPKPFPEVRQSIIDQIAGTNALAQAKSMVDALNKAIDDQGLDGQKDPAGFLQAAKQLGLSNVTLSVARPQQARSSQQQGEETLTLGAIGTYLDDAQFFSPDKEAGFTSRPMEILGAHPTFALARLESRTEAGFKQLAEVQPEVIAYLQSRNAYADFIVAAKKARADAQKTVGGLKAYLASPAGAFWKATVTSSTLPVRKTLVAPPDQADEPPSSDTIIAASLALADHAVALVGENPPSDDRNALPTVSLVQGTGIVPATTAQQADLTPDMKREEAREEAMQYRGALKQFSSSLFMPTVERQLR